MAKTRQSERTLDDLKELERNPRVITEARQKKLEADLERFGDLSGVVFNVTTNRVVGGNQRTKVFRAGKGTITRDTVYGQPTKQGTVAEGFITWKGNRYSYREVQWDKATERDANILANLHAGEFDYVQLGENFKPQELRALGMHIDIQSGGGDPPPPPPIIDRKADAGGSDGDGSGEDDGNDNPPPPPRAQEPPPRHRRSPDHKANFSSP